MYDQMLSYSEQDRRRIELDIFLLIWEDMAENGEADAPGSAEYRRILADFKREGCPSVNARTFIRSRNGAYTPPA